MEDVELCNEVGEDDYECEVLIRARFHFRESDKMGRVTIAWVYLDTLDDLVGQATRCLNSQVEGAPGGHQQVC